MQQYPDVRLRLERDARRIWDLEFAVSNTGRHPVIHISAAKWLSDDANLLDFDREVHRQEDTLHDACLVLDDVNRQTEGAVLQILTRYQRLLPVCNAVPPLFESVLALHRSLYDVRKPLVRADFDHAIDTWRWLLRLRPHASPELQIAALFHDIERLSTEADRRIEQLADDYLAFKQSHARTGAGTVLRLLQPLASELAHRAAELILQHEQPSTDTDVAALNDADSLSFFSLNSWGFLQYFGRTHTEMKVRYTLKRMGHQARSELRRLRYHPDINQFIFRATEEQLR